MQTTDWPPLFSVKLKCVFFSKILELMSKGLRNSISSEIILRNTISWSVCFIHIYQIPNKDIYRLLTHVLCNFTEKKGNSSNSDITNNISSSYDLGFGSGNQLFQERVRVQASHDCFALWSKIFYSCQCYDHHCWWTIR